MATASSSDVADTQSERVALAPNVIRHPTLYFDDGDIVLAIDQRKSLKTKKAADTVYRVDKIFLARQSKVFADMFSLPPGPSGTHEEYDGVPMVRLAEHDPPAFEDVLKFIYNAA